MVGEKNNSKHHLCDLKVPFPFKMHEMLSDVVKDGNESIVSWQPHGKAFRVHNAKEFVEMIMQRYFHQTQYKSFQRQLHIYGFRRISTGLDKGSYYHPMFVKGNELVCLRMTRCKIKGSLLTEMMELDEPNFYQQAEPASSGVENRMTGLNDQGYSSMISASSAVSTTICAETVFSKAVSLPILPFSRTTRLGEDHQQQPDPSQLRRNVSCDVVTPNSHHNRMMTVLAADEMPPPSNMTFVGGNPNQNTTRMTISQDDFQPLPLNRRIPQNRRGSLLEEGDEAFFAGKKYFFIDHPSSLTRLATTRCFNKGGRRSKWASV